MKYAHGLPGRYRRSHGETKRIAGHNGGAGTVRCFTDHGPRTAAAHDRVDRDNQGRYYRLGRELDRLFR